MIKLKKRRISLFLPIRHKRNGVFVYLQKRSKSFKTLPGYFAFWGGGAEGTETAEKTLRREVHEELNFIFRKKQISFFNHYEFLRSTKDVFLFEAPADWEEQIVVREGDYGKWFSTQDILKKRNVILEDKVVICDLERILLRKPIV